jgi:hypothetical protein
VQIQNYHNDLNPYNHTIRDSPAYINPDYLFEQMKATTAIAGHLAVPLARKKVYIPFFVFLKYE